MPKDTRLNIRIAPEFQRELQAVAKFHGLTVSSYVHSLLVKQIRREHEENPQLFISTASPPAKPASPARRALREAIYRAIPEADFDLETEIRDGLPPDVIMSKWLIYEGKEPPHDYGLLMFGGWETMTPEERTDALRDAKKVLDRNFQRNGADVKPFPVAVDAPLRRDIQRQIDEVPLKPPKAKRRTKK